MFSNIQLGILPGRDTSRGCFPSQPCPTCPYKQEVDYRGFNEAIRVTLASYHWSGMQDASTINLSLSTTLTLMINTLLPLEREWSTQKGRKPDEQYQQDAYMDQKLITREISEASSDRTWICQGTSHRESTDRLVPPPNSSLTLSHYYL
jgi:hypothetical protein